MSEEVIKDKIDVIIPAYNCHNTIERCIMSIIVQTIKNDLKVTIVDDCSDHNYFYLLDKYGKDIDLNVIRMDQNGGPGIARQMGFDNTTNPLITFIDADDVFSSPFSLELLRNWIYEDDYEKNVGAWGTFFENQTAESFVKHPPASVWMFGKLYKRSFWIKHGICFHPTSRYNEDTGVNLMCELFSNNEDERIIKKDELVYYWMNGQRTITRKDGNVDDYGDNHGLVGYAENCTRTMLYCMAHNNNNIIRSKALEILMFLYLYYCKAEQNNAYLLDLVRYRCAEFYQKVYLQYNNFTKMEKTIYFKNSLNNMSTIIPQYTFEEWEKMMAEYDLTQPVPEYINERRIYE